MPTDQSYASLNDLLKNYAQLKEKGISPYWCIHHGITVSMYYADPDGNQMEFQVDSYSSSEDADAFINAHFSTNPLGVEYDPEDWLARDRGGQNWGAKPAQTRQTAPSLNKC